MGTVVTIAPLELIYCSASRLRAGDQWNGQPSGHTGTSRDLKGAIALEYGFPRCRKCGAGELVPLSDFGSQGASIQFKAWVCTNPNCLYNVKIRNGDIIINEPVNDGSAYTHRAQR